MKRTLLATLTLLLIAGAMPALGQRWVERHSTEPGNDLERAGFSGKITSIEGQIAYVKTDDGQRIAVNLGPRWYWHERGYRLRSGLQVEVSGWWDNDDRSSCFAGYISGDGFHFELADSEGYPLWAQYGERGRDWRPSRDVIGQYYRYPPRRAPRGWYAPRYSYWNNHWRPYYNQRPYYYSRPYRGRYDCGGPRYRNNPPPRQRGWRRGH